MGSGFREEAQAEFRNLIGQQAFPCLGARAALNAGSYQLKVYAELGGKESTEELARDLRAFSCSELRADEYATFIAVFRAPEIADELQFENLLWQQLRLLNQIDARDASWDGTVSSDPQHPMFSFSFAGHALYVIGLHAQSSRLARRFPWPTLVFNPHEQFERLRGEGKWRRMQQAIRARDFQLQGSINPMLSDFGESSEARQYSGRAVEEDWRAPFKAANNGRCPFHH